MSSAQFTGASSGVGAWSAATITSAKAENSGALPLESRLEPGCVRIQGIVKAKEAIPAKTNFAKLVGMPEVPVGTCIGLATNLVTGAAVGVRIDLSGNVSLESEVLLNGEVCINITYPTTK